MALRYKLFLSCCALTMAAACAYARGFRLEGRIEGLQAGDTLRFERILLPSWKYGPGFDVVVRKPGAFRHRGKSEHDQYYLMTYRPKAGRAAAGQAQCGYDSGCGGSLQEAAAGDHVHGFHSGCSFPGAGGKSKDPLPLRDGS